MADAFVIITFAGQPKEAQQPLKWDGRPDTPDGSAKLTQ